MASALPSIRAARLTYEKDGAQLEDAAVDSATLQKMSAVLGGQRKSHAGTRLFGVAGLHSFLNHDGPLGALAAGVLGERTRPVRAVLFDKSPETNWAVGWHQDRVIAVARRVDVEGFGPWTLKQGALHVAPPFQLLARMVTVRLHFDDVPETNAPLLVAPGSHRLGRIPEAQVSAAVRQCGTVACLACAGDVWLYATPILHASQSATVPCSRRVLQVDYAAEDLPAGLQWLGI